MTLANYKKAKDLAAGDKIPHGVVSSVAARGGGVVSVWFTCADGRTSAINFKATQPIAVLS